MPRPFRSRRGSLKTGCLTSALALLVLAAGSLLTLLLTAPQAARALTTGWLEERGFTVEKLEVESLGPSGLLLGNVVLRQGENTYGLESLQLTWQPAELLQGRFEVLRADGIRLAILLQPLPPSEGEALTREDIEAFLRTLPPPPVPPGALVALEGEALVGIPGYPRILTIPFRMDGSHEERVRLSFKAGREHLKMAVGLDALPDASEAFGHLTLEGNLGSTYGYDAVQILALWLQNHLPAQSFPEQGFVDVRLGGTYGESPSAAGTFSVREVRGDGYNGLRYEVDEFTGGFTWQADRLRGLTLRGEGLTGAFPGGYLFDGGLGLDYTPTREEAAPRLDVAARATELHLPGGLMSGGRTGRPVVLTLPAGWEERLARGQWKDVLAGTTATGELRELTGQTPTVRWENAHLAFEADTLHPEKLTVHSAEGARVALVQTMRVALREVSTGPIRYRPGELAVAGVEAKLWGGTVRATPVAFDPAAPALRTKISFENVLLQKAAELLPFEGTASGPVNGTVEIALTAEGRLRLLGGQLGLADGTEGTLAYPKEGWLTEGLPKGSLEYLRKRVIEEALRGIRLTALELKVREPGSREADSIVIKGRAAKEVMLQGAPLGEIRYELTLPDGAQKWLDLLLYGEEHLR